MIYRYLNINELNTEEISMKVSKDRIERSAKFKNDADRKRSVAVEYLLFDMVEECTGYRPDSLIYDSKRKPHILDDKGCDLINFSLSHSGDYVACIVSDKLCGIDIEKHSEKREYEKIAKRVCTENELKYVDSQKAFYDIWTLKESMLKATGEGLSLDMRKAEFIEDKDSGAISDQNGISFYISEYEGIKYRGTVLTAPDGYSLSYVEAM